MPVPWLVPAIIGAVNLVGGLVGQSRQKKENRELAQFQADANERYLQKQLEYNTPKSQMQRFQQAGLNPHLVYGQGNPGSQSSPLSYPETKSTDYQTMYGTIIPSVIQGALAESQIAAQSANTRRTGVLTQVDQLRAAVLSKNPLLDEEGFTAIIDALKSTAESKAAEAGIASETHDWFRGVKQFRVEGKPTREGPAGVLKMEAELDLLEQRFRLGEKDASIKAQVLQSKEFQNAILDIQKKFMTEGDITPQHIYQFIILLLTKML